MIAHTAFILVIVPMLSPPGSPAAIDPASRPAAPTAEERRVGDAYYLGSCATCDALLGTKGDTADRVLAGRELRFCCDACREQFEASPGPSAERLDRVMIADQLPHYPLKVSIVSGKPLPEKPFDMVWGNRVFRLAGEDECERVLADPPRYIKLLDRAVIEQQEPTYGMPTKCPVQGDILESDTPIDIVVANRMVRVCCWRCVRMVRARPSQYLSMVEYANRAAAERRALEADPPLTEPPP